MMPGGGLADIWSDILKPAASLVEDSATQENRCQFRLRKELGVGSKSMAHLQCLCFLHRVTRACAREARFSPGFNMMGFQP